MHSHFMSLALREAEKAFRLGEVPVGAVVVHAGKVIGRGHNRVETRRDATQHAEIMALRQAARKMQSWRLPECDLYVTLEPCAMCAGAIVWSRVKRVIYGAADPKAGACGSVVEIIANPRLNHRPDLAAGVMESECQALLKRFFQDLRSRKALK